MFLFYVLSFCQKRGHYSRGDIIKGRTLIKEIRYTAENFLKVKKEINKDCIDNGKKIGKFGGGEKEYFDLPYGWTKEVVYLRNQPNMKGKTRQDIYLISPGSNGKKIKSDIKLQKFLEENPNIKCDLAVTSTKKTVHTEFLMNRTFG